MSLSKTIVIMFILASISLSGNLIIRPQGGYGYFHSADSENNGPAYHVGARILLSASSIRRYGFEISRFNVKNGESFSSIGIILEQKMWNWFNNSIGSVGYFGFGDNSDNIVGLMSNLGWEPDWNRTLKPFVTYRNDLIFSDKITNIHSLSAGFTFGF